MALTISVSGVTLALYWLGILALIALGIACGLTLTKPGAEYLLDRRLTHVRHLPESSSAVNDVVYVLGGTPASVRAKLRTASNLIRSGMANRVLVGTGKDDCAGASFAARGIGADAVQCVALEAGLFGTWSEAKLLSRIVRERGYRRLILVTSPYHSRRVWESFASTVDQPDARLYLYVTSEAAARQNLLPEYVKLLVYRTLLF